MMKQDIFEKIKAAADHGSVTPSDAVWNKLEQRLDAHPLDAGAHTKVFRLFTRRKLSIAASILVLLGAYGVLHNIGGDKSESTAIQLEDLHTLEVNPRYHVTPLGESSTIPSIQMTGSIPTTYKGINEGRSDKKLMKRRSSIEERSEYGLG